MLDRIEELMKHDTAGDPITGIKWSRRTSSKIAEQLGTLGITIGKTTVRRLLKTLDYKLRVNRKQIATSKSPDRNASNGASTPSGDCLSSACTRIRHGSGLCTVWVSERWGGSAETWMAVGIEGARPAL